jgi:hypothetical protein
MKRWCSHHWHYERVEINTEGCQDDHPETETMKRKRCCKCAKEKITSLFEYDGDLA